MTTPHPILDVLEARARDNPDRPAFEFVREGKTVTLTRQGQINRVAHLGARFRHDHGDGAKIAIVMENRPAWAVAFFSNWYAGAVAVPLDPQLDATKIGRIIAHADTSMVITSNKHKDKVAEAIAGTDLEVFNVDDAGEFLWDGAGELPREDVPADWDPRVSSDGLGALVYTSGTTGDPKGVMLELDAIVKNMDTIQKRIELQESDRVLGVLPLYHMLPLIGNCVGIAYTGGTTIFLDSPTPESILNAFREHRITLFPCVPLFFYRFHEKVHATIDALSPFKRRIARRLMAISRFGRRRLGINLGKRLLGVIHKPFGPAMRLLFTGGAKMNPEVHAELLDWGFTFNQGYGLTEATAALTVVGLDELRADSVGPALEGIDLEIREPNEDGIGEIWARSPSMMRGYYKNEEATAAAIVDGWLRTGDLGRIAPDGHLTVTGRAKDVIVLASGKNVYPDELEEHYARSDFIAEICVVGREDSNRLGAERVHAVVVPDLEAARRKGYVNVREMVLWELENLGSELPSWQRLTSVDLRSDPLPRTTTRKVRRIEIREEVERAGERTDAASIATEPAPDPHDERDHELLAIVAQRAGRETVGRANHLDLDLGFDSLDRVELITELGLRLGTEPPMEELGSVHTTGELIDVLRAAPAAKIADAPAVIDEDTRWKTLFASTPQEFLPYVKRSRLAEWTVWFLSRIIRLLARTFGGLRVTGLENLPKDGPFLVCPNHTSYLDVLMITAALPRRMLARSFFVGFSEYFEGVVGRTFSKVVRNIPVDQNRNMERSLQAAAEGLRRGLILVAFPEGARSIDGNVLAFRRGPAILARQLDTPIVPVGIWGAFEAWPRDRGLRPHPIGIAFGPPLSDDVATETPHPNSAALSDALRDRVIALIDVARSLWRPKA